MAIDLDLRTHAVSPAKRLWIVHPGRNRQFFDDFVTSGGVFLGFPDLIFRQPQSLTDAQIRQRVRYSRAVRAQAGFTKTDGTPIRVADFSAAPGNDVSTHLRTVRHLLDRMKDGDAVIVPGRGAEGRVLFGEVDGAYSASDVVRPTGITYADVPLRKIRWTSTTDFFKTDLPRSLVKIFEKPPAIAEVGRNDVSDRFFDYVYGAYYTERYSACSVTAPTYNGSDLLSIVPPTQLIAFAVALYNAHKSGDVYNHLSYEELISKYYDDNLLEDARIRFSSPGRYGLRDTDSLLTMFINGVVALAIAGSLAACGAQPNSLNARNSSTHDPAKAAIIEQMIGQAASSAGQAALTRADVDGHSSKTKVGLHAPARAR